MNDKLVVLAWDGVIRVLINEVYCLSIDRLISVDHNLHDWASVNDYYLYELNYIFVR